MNKEIIDNLDPDITAKKTINGIEYIAQLPPVRQAMELRQRWQDSNGNVIATTMHDLVLEHLIVKPQGLKVDDFRRASQVEEITGWALNFVYGDEKN